MRDMYLIQRGTIRPEVVKEYLDIPSEDRSARFNRPLTGREGVVSLDYMGAAEYEWGAIPATFTRIMYRYPYYRIHKSSISTKNDIPLWIFCPNGKFSEVEAALLRFLNDTNHTIRLKEWIRFRDVYMANPGDDMKYAENFWWDIENDFLFWFGGDDYANTIMEAISTDYNSWWKTLSDEEVEERYAAATHGLHGRFWKWYEEAV